jgi:5-keto-L-gluconate epimerase
MKYGIVISVSPTSFGPIVFKEDLIKNIDNAKILGFSGVELAVKNPKDLNVIVVKAALDRNGLESPVLGTGQIYVDHGVSLSDERKEVRVEALERLKGVIDIAAVLNSTMIIGCVRGTVDNSKKDTEKAFKKAKKRVADGMAACLEYGQNKQVDLLLEPLNRYETNLFNSIDETRSFLDDYKELLDLSRIGILADTFHMNIEDRNIADSLKEHSDLIRHIHLADSNRYAPGFGHIDFNKIMWTLEEIGYQGYLSFEMLPYPDSQISASQGIEYIKQIENTIRRYKT